MAGFELTSPGVSMCMHLGFLKVGSLLVRCADTKLLDGLLDKVSLLLKFCEYYPNAYIYSAEAYLSYFHIAS